MSFLTYLLQVSGCITLFYVFYYACLSRLTFFTVNRYYLLSSLLLGFVIPLITIPVHQDYPVLAATHIVQLPSPAALVFKPAVMSRYTIIQHGFVISWLMVLKIVYAAVSTFLLLRFVAILAAFFINLRKHQVEQSNGLRIIRSSEKLTNGSFLNYIFLDDAELKSNEAEQVIAHETLHIKLKHSADRILGRIAQIILWFNPVMYLYTRAIEQNHEFEVDSLLTENENKQTYAGLLLQLSVNKGGLVYNSFSKSPLQSRITMLFNARSSKVKQLVYLLILPLLSLSFIAFANMKRIYTPKALNRSAVIITEPSRKANIIPTIQIENPIAQETKGSSSDTTTEEFKAPAENATDTLRVSVIKGLERLGRSPLVVIDGKEYSSDILYTIGHACIRGTGMWMPDSAVKYFGPKAKDGYVQIRTKNGQITNQTDDEHANLVTENMVAIARERALKSMVMLNRVVLKKSDGGLYDRIIEVHNGGSMSIDVEHNAKVAFFIDSTYYSEQDIQKVLAEKYSQLSGVSGTHNLDIKKMPGNSLNGYESVMFFWSKTNSDKEEEKQEHFNWEKYIPNK